MTSEKPTVTIWDAVGEYIVNHPEMTLDKLTEDADLGHYVNQFSMDELRQIAASPTRCQPRKAHNSPPGETGGLDDLVLKLLSSTPQTTRQVMEKAQGMGVTVDRVLVFDSLRRQEDAGCARRTGSTNGTLWTACGLSADADLFDRIYAQKDYWKKLSHAQIDHVVFECLVDGPKGAGAISAAIRGKLAEAKDEGSSRHKLLVSARSIPRENIYKSLKRLVADKALVRTGNSTATVWGLPSYQPWRKMSEAEIDDLVLEQLDTEPLRTRLVHSSILCTPEHDGFPLSKVWDSLRRLVALGLVKRSGQTSTTAWAIDA